MEHAAIAMELAPGPQSMERGGGTSSSSGKPTGYFFMGQTSMSKVTPLGQEPVELVDQVVMKTCVCNGCCCEGCFTQTQFLDTYDAYPESVSSLLEGNGLSVLDLKVVLSEVHADFHARKACCWKAAYCGPLMFVFWWLDNLCGSGWISKPLCFKPAMNAIQKILDKHNQRMSANGVKIELIDGTLTLVTLSSNLSTHDVDLTTWALKFTVGEA